MSQLKIKVTLECLCFSWVSVQFKINVTLAIWCFHGLRSQWKINVTLESFGFRWVTVPVEDEYDLGKGVVFMY